MRWEPRIVARGAVLGAVAAAVAAGSVLRLGPQLGWLVAAAGGAVVGAFGPWLVT